jgi:hypothetical protein
MLNVRFMLMFGALVLGGGCARKDLAAQVPPAVPLSASTRTANVPPQLDASSAQAPAAPPPLQPLAEGKRVRIAKLHVPPLEITVPPDFTLRMEGSEESNLEAILQGPDWQVFVREPEGGFLTLAEKKDMLLRGDPGATFMHAQRTADGFALVDHDNIDGPSKYSARITRRALGVTCGAWGLDNLVDAEKAASICLTLGPAPGRGKRH